MIKPAPSSSESTRPGQPTRPEVNLDENKVHLATCEDGLNLLNRRSLGSTAVKKINETELVWIRKLQTTHFKEELGKLKYGRQLSLRGNLHPLSPVIDGVGILRVGGMLFNSNREGTHSNLLQARDSLGEGLVRYEHKRLFHAGPELHEGSLRRRIWIIDAHMVATVKTADGKFNRLDLKLTLLPFHTQEDLIVL
ncbi:unnamed protein product [Allacma fusca]|uniref:Uncharacterized protein n=1 Tax=Allacma fusca TaxID=39272 RepID=A0A8J2P1L5_9HEXA|nr:unnamed protein product [Allacma fusca]